jgi:protein-tyrosine phosphatase
MASIVRKLHNRRNGISDETDVLDISEIAESLFISNWPIAKHVPVINSYDIDLIVCTVMEMQDKELKKPPLKMVQIRLIDAPFLPMPLFQLRRGVEAALPIMESGGKVLTFCKSGIHRSAAMASRTLIGQGYSAEEAISLVESKRPQADLNDALRKRIKTFEQAWHEQDGSSIRRSP